MVSTNGSCSDCRTLRGGAFGGGTLQPPLQPGFFGQGRANLVLSPGAEGVDFSYVGCPSRINILEPLAAKWKKQDKELEVLIPQAKPGQRPDPNNLHFDKCDVKVVPRDYVFVPGGGSNLEPATLSLADYRQNAAMQSLIEGIRKDLPATGAPPSKPTGPMSPEELAATAQRVDSTTIRVPAIPNAPFTATVVTQWQSFISLTGVPELSQNGQFRAYMPPDPTDSNGNPTQPPPRPARGISNLPAPSPDVLRSSRVIARDSAGRVFEERRAFVPLVDPNQAPLVSLIYIDPAQHLRYQCSVDTKTCHTLPYLTPAAAISGTPSDKTTVTDLGQQTMEHLNVAGTIQVTYNRIPGVSQYYSTTLPPSDEDRFQRSEESWFSPQLQINLREHRAGAPVGNLLDVVQNLNLSANPNLFQPPADYKILPAKQPQQAASK